jgi:hypothetical protein
MCCSTPGQLLRAGSTHWSRFSEFCRHLQLRGNLLSDAYLAALALEQGAELITFDRGFGRHPGLRGAACSTTSETTDPSGSIMALPPPSEVVVESGGQVALEVQAVRVGEHRVEPSLPLEGAPPRSRMNET